MSMLHMPPTNKMWSKTNRLASNISPVPLSASVCLFAENPRSTDA